MDKIQAGIYEANISEYGIGPTKSGDPQVMILFNYNDLEGTPHEITWFGSLKEGKAQEITMRTILYCGFNGSDPADLAEGVSSGLLDVATPVKITIEESEYQGKKSMKVAWVNRMGSQSMEKRISKSEAKIKLGALNLKGALAAMRQETGIRVEPRASKPAMAVGQSTPSFEDDDIGF